MQTVSMPATPTLPAKPAAVVLPAAKPEPAPMPPMMPRYGYPPYPYAPYAWPGYPYPVPPMPPVDPPPASSTPTAEPVKETPKAEKPVEKPVEKPKTAEEKAEDELVDIFRQFIRSNPKLKAILTPDVIQQLKSVADNPSKMKDMLITEVAKGQVGQQVKQFLGKGFVSRMAQKVMMWISPPATDPLLSSFFKQLGIE